MREIKFRAWLRNDQRMINPVIAIDFASPHPSIGWYEDEHAALAGTVDNCFLDEDVVLMQYTGLKDRNDKEIYKDDIVRVKIMGGYSDHYTDKEYLKVVEYDHHAACWKPFDRCRMWREDDGNLKAVEVIGNIHEHPHLLGGNQG